MIEFLMIEFGISKNKTNDVVKTELIDAIVKKLRDTNYILDEHTRQWIAELFDPNGKTDFEVVLKRRKGGNPSQHGAAYLDMMERLTHIYRDANFDKEAACEIALQEYKIAKHHMDKHIKTAIEIVTIEDENSAAIREDLLRELDEICTTAADDQTAIAEGMKLGFTEAGVRKRLAARKAG